MRLTQHFSNKRTRQAERIPGSNQTMNRAGGWVWTIDPWQRLERLLILGTEGGTYYVREERLTREQASATIQLIGQDGPGVVRRVVEISQAGRAPKNDAALFVLALASAYGDEKTRRAAHEALPMVARTGAHLLQFASEVEELRGWGRGLRRAVGKWYLEQPVNDLAYQALKYQQRKGWSHRDLLRLAHPSTADEAQNGLFRWMVAGSTDAAPEQIQAWEALKLTDNMDEAVRLIRTHRLPREAVPTEWLAEPEVWEALLEDMPMTAMIRNLGVMTRYGLLTPRSEATREVVARLEDEERLRRARVHPLAVLIAHRTYTKGMGSKGGSVFLPVKAVGKALEAAFYKAFASVEPTGKRHLLGLDVSGSMSWHSVAGSPLTAAEASAAMALVALATEPETLTMAFADQFRKLNLTAGMSLRKAQAVANRMNFGGTDCSLPMTWAMRNGVEADVFVVYTDNETWAGDIHPAQALREYRQRTGIDAKLIVVGMAGDRFSIADPDDPGMLDIVGFDAAAPAAMRQFVVAD